MRISDWSSDVCSSDLQLAFKFSEGSKYAEDETAVGGRGVNRRAFASEYLQANFAGGEFSDGIDQMAEISAEPIQLPDCQRVTGAERLQASVESWTIIATSRGAVRVDFVRLYTRRDQCVALKIMDLRSIGFRDTGISDQHVTYTSVYGARLPAPCHCMG